MKLSWKCLWLSLLATANATTLRLTIPPSSILPNPAVLPGTTHATLTTAGRRISVPVRAGQADFIFQIPDSVPALSSSSPGSPGSPGKEDGAGKGTEYILTIDSKDYLFRTYRVDVQNGKVEIWEVTRGVPWDRPGSVALGGPGRGVGDADKVLEVGVLGRRGFFEQRATFSPLSLLKNPMILLAVAALGLTFGMPKLMENMDPEMREEFEKQSRSGPISGSARNAMQGGGFDLAGWMAGTAQPGSGQDGQGQIQGAGAGAGAGAGQAGSGSASGSGAGSGNAKRRRG